MTGIRKGAAEILFDVFVGEEPNATYYPQGGSSVSCRLRLSQRNRSNTQYSDLDVSGIEVHLLESEVGSRVQQGDRIEYDGKVYYIADQPTGDGYVWTVFLHSGVATA